ncbi:unnamed protein product [Chrysodeixis includens]|uniref:Uncharacterized protein n=1 Tax=Chrysodeixis includens TaxID=689277 RepID=A0A9N8KVC8_CHRIL|nr:unnamed protein product [Chrysodeixis includens]
MAPHAAPPGLGCCDHVCSPGRQPGGVRSQTDVDKYRNQGQAVFKPKMSEDVMHEEFSAGRSTCPTRSHARSHHSRIAVADMTGAGTRYCTVFVRVAWYLPPSLAQCAAASSGAGPCRPALYRAPPRRRYAQTTHVTRRPRLADALAHSEYP